MQDKLVTLFALIVIGFLNIILIYKFRSDEEYARNYIAKNPKAFIFKKIFGEEKAYQVTMKYFIPLGCVISALLILGGGVLFVINYFQ
jgi:hypothetical protein